MSCSGKKNEVKKKAFKPDYKQKALSEKFYARHDQLILNPNYEASYKRYCEEIGRKQIYIPMHTYQMAPLTGNQIYGWMHYLADTYEPGYDKVLFCRHRKTNEEIKEQIKINSAVLRGLKR